MYYILDIILYKFLFKSFYSIYIYVSISASVAYGSKIRVTYPQVLPVSGADSSARYSVSRRRGCDKKYKKPHLVQAVERERVKNVQVLFGAWTYVCGVTGYASHAVTCGVGAGDQSAFPHDPLPGSPSRMANPQLLPFGRI